MHQLVQCCPRECIDIEGILNSLIKDSLEKHVLLIFKNFCVVLEAMNIVACYRLGKIKRFIIKLLNRKDAEYILEENCSVKLQLEQKQQYNNKI